VAALDEHAVALAARLAGGVDGDDAVARLRGRDGQRAAARGADDAAAAQDAIAGDGTGAADGGAPCQLHGAGTARPYGKVGDRAGRPASLTSTRQARTSDALRGLAAEHGGDGDLGGAAGGDAHAHARLGRLADDGTVAGDAEREAVGRLARRAPRDGHARAGGVAGELEVRGAEGAAVGGRLGGAGRAREERARADGGQDEGTDSHRDYSTVTVLARLRGWSTLSPRATATW
jgi:hypothetical protein